MRYQEVINTGLAQALSTNPAAPTQITNDASTNDNRLPPPLDLWDSSVNEFSLTGVSPGRMLLVSVSGTLQSGARDNVVLVSFHFGIGGAGERSIVFALPPFPAGVTPLAPATWQIPISSADFITLPGRLEMSCTAADSFFTAGSFRFGY